MAKTKAPQLVWDRGVPIWRATRAAIKAGFPTERANLKFFADNEAALVVFLDQPVPEVPAPILLRAGPETPKEVRH